MVRAAIVGAGFSGSICCIQLLKSLGKDVRITLVERSPRQLQRGVAYSARLSQQLLNVPVERMGMFPDDPGDFLRWARSGPLPHVKAGDFLPRMLYGDYVSDRFNEWIDAFKHQVRVKYGEAVSLDHHPAHGYRLGLDSGRVVQADVVILALGNAPFTHVPGLDPTAGKWSSYVPWPWKAGVLENMGPDNEVLFIGAGLTMIDLLLSREDAGAKAHTTVLSRHGRLPLPHAAPGSHHLEQPLPEGPYTVAALMRWLRNEVRIAGRRGVPWQHVMDAVLPFVPDWWQALDVPEKKRFLRHVRPFWEIHRHRMPAHSHERITGMLDTNRVTLLAGRIKQVTKDDQHLHVIWEPGGGQDTRELWTRHIVNCTGPQADSLRLDQPLLEDLLAKGFGAWDPLHMGLATSPEGGLVDPSGRPSESLFAVGPLCKATRWECTAVPEIRKQAQRIAERVEKHREQIALKGWRQVLARISDRLALIDA